jgi:hypothetical protein
VALVISKGEMVSDECTRPESLWKPVMTVSVASLPLMGYMVVVMASEEPLT